MNPLAYTIIGLLVAATCAGCGKDRTASAASTAVEEVQNCDSIPTGVKRFVKAIEKNDRKELAAVVSYPLQRPYPLHDIESAEEMEKYYAVMVDDSLRLIVTNAHPSDWVEDGWRGYTLKDGGYVWIDDSVYEIPYVSKRERTIRDSLSRREMSSVSKRLRGDWHPEFCLRGSENQTIYRIDSKKNKGKEKIYRMVVYEKDADLTGDPAELLTGHKETEGTAQTAIYYFSGDGLVKAIYTPDVTDDTPPSIEYTGRDGTTLLIPVERVYWLDLIK